MYCSISKDTLVSSSYDHSLEHVSTNSYSWLSILKKIQDKLDNATTMMNLYSNIWLSDICRPENNKLINYSKFKNNFILEKYLLHYDTSERRNLTKLRISAHYLQIESGRYTKPKTPRQNRL